MKQPMRNRILSFLLALLLFANNAPFTAFSLGGNPGSGTTGTTVTQPLQYDYDSMYIARNGAKIDSLQLKPYEKIEISADGLAEDATYQWQVEHPEKDGVWVNIYDGTHQSIGVSLALVENVLRADGTARLRCRAYTEDYAYLSNAITVRIVSEEKAVMAGKYTSTHTGVALAEDPIEFVTVEIHYVKYEYVEHVDDKGVKSYVLQETGEAYGAYVATIRNGSSLSVDVPNPVIVGFNASLVLENGQTGATMANDTVSINLSEVKENVSFRVEYRPAMVNYSAHYYFQNIYDDLYVEDTALAPSKTLQGYTGDMPSADVTHLAVKGFTALFYEPDIIAADGSTVFNVYYERNYYLIEFDCAGGFGADTIYVRYGTYIAVADPVRAGYVFGGWDLVSTDNSDNAETLNDGHANPLPQTLQAYNSAYTAIWTIARTTYTVVYWRENADDSKYSYWGSRQVNANSNDRVTATSHTSLTGIDLPEKDYFTYNGEMTVEEESQRTDLDSDGKVIVEGDGSTVVNVYYSRNVYTLEFNIGTNTFVVPEGGHQHTDGNCVPDLLCGITDHVHGDDCISTLICTIPEHEVHTPECLICDDPEHKHGITCLLCDQENHTHTQTCCNLDEHKHSTSCYSLSGGSWGNAYNGTPTGTTADNGIVRTGTFNNYKYYYKIGDTWYEITGLSSWNGYGSYYEDVTFTQTQSCKNGHSHDDGNCDYSDCSLHVHSASCYVCKKTEHIHSADCCTLEPHTHDIACYNPNTGYTAGISSSSTTTNNAIAAITDPKEGYIYRYNRSGTYHNFFYTSSGWYYLGTNNQYRGLLNGTISDPDRGNYSISNLPALEKCGKTAHSHDDGNCAYCTDGHLHSDSCLDCGLAEHDHEDSCYRDEIHTHEDSCYTWICGDSAHTHTDECYGSCIKPENYVSGQVYIIKAKYNQTIGKIWPTAACFTNRYFQHWTITGISSNATSKRINMTADLCNTAAGGNQTKTATATYITSNTEPSKQTLFYMFESFDQSDYTDGDNRRELGDVFYDHDIVYSQQVYSTATNWSQKDITGMTAVSGGVKYEANNTKVFFYYKRDRSQLHFHNVNAVVRTYSDVMYGIPLNAISTDALGFASEYEPPYPSVYEPNAYRFKGWYTTPECFERTKVDWSTFMPENDLTLYAKWEPVNLNVYFHLTYQDIATNTYWQTTDQQGKPVTYPITVPHGSVLGTTYHYTPTRSEDHDGDGVPDYTFIGWFYIDEAGKKRFAPDTMEIKRNLHLFAEWQTTIDTEYSVEYILQNEETINGVKYDAGTVLAVPTEGHSTAGRTKTFTAKAGDQLLADFKDMALFPVTNTHSILMDANPTANRYVFEYVLDPEVYYKIRYVNKATGEVLEETVDQPTSNSILTVKYKHFEGYVPEQFYIRKVLASDGGSTQALEENWITFYYLPNTQNEGIYNVEYYKKNILTGEYEQVQTEPGRATIGQSLSVTVATNKFTGFAFTKSEILSYQANGSYTTTTQGSSQTTLTANLGAHGLVFRLYYDPIEYPYLIRFVDRDTPTNILGYGMLDGNGNIIMENGTPKVYTSLNDVKNAKADFDAALTYTAPDQIISGDRIYNFLAGSTQTQTLTIRIEQNTTDASACQVNILTFYYVREVIPIEYHSICTIPGIIGGNVSQNSDPMPQSPQGCDAMKLSGFTFEGWYFDEACTQPVPDGWLSDPLPGDGVDEKSYLKPPASQIEKGSDGKEHFYALFKPIVTKLELQNAVNVPANIESFLFHLQGAAGTVTGGVDMIVSFTGNGKLTVDNIYCGSYTVTVLTDWSWKYGDIPVWAYSDGSAGRIIATIVVTKEGGILTFTNAYAEPDWLGGENIQNLTFNGT